MAICQWHLMRRTALLPLCQMAALETLRVPPAQVEHDCTSAGLMLVLTAIAEIGRLSRGSGT